MSRKISIFDDLIQLPWWLSVVLAVVTYIGYQFVFPMWEVSGLIKPFLNAFVPLLGPVFTFAFIITGIISAFHSWRKGELVDSQTSLRTIKDVPWKEFEFLVSEAYRRQGYQVQENLKGGADGGIDLVLTKESEITFVQCKQWKTKSIPVTTIRELYGVMMAEGANKGIVVCSGSYTKDAIQFAEGKPIELIDGLRSLIGSIQKTGKMVKSDNLQPTCPKCSSSMVLRKATKGKNIGQTFFGCSTFPRCRGIRQTSS